VDPVQPSRHPGAGLVKVRHRRGGELIADGGQEPIQPDCTLGQDGGQRAGRHRRAEHIGQQFARPGRPAGAGGCTSNTSARTPGP
jgi:hypothetical protein